MTTPPLPRHTRDTIAHSRLYVCLVTPAWLRDPQCSAELAYAVHLGKPIRLLVEPGVRLPETFLTSVTDLQVARLEGAETAAAQIQAWLEALPSGQPQEAP